MVKRVESSQLQEFLPVESARTAAAVKARINLAKALVPMPHPQRSLLPPAFRQAGFLALLFRIGKENLARYRKDVFAREPFEQWWDKVGRAAHVAVQQNDDVVLRRPEPRVRSAPNPQVPRQAKNIYFRKCFGDKFRAATRRAVIDDDDFTSWMNRRSRRH